MPHGRPAALDTDGVERYLNLAFGAAAEGTRGTLAAIAGSVQVLKGSKSLTHQEQRLMSIVLKESERLNKSISDFLRFVRPQEQRLDS